eukprot:scaffold212250_cov28-Tisochrysis_lutea.AAC.3
MRTQCGQLASLLRGSLEVAHCRLPCIPPVASADRSWYGAWAPCRAMLQQSAVRIVSTPHDSRRARPIDWPPARLPARQWLIPHSIQLHGRLVIAGISSPLAAALQCQLVRRKLRPEWPAAAEIELWHHIPRAIDTGEASTLVRFVPARSLIDDPQTLLVVPLQSRSRGHLEQLDALSCLCLSPLAESLICGSQGIDTPTE